MTTSNDTARLGALVRSKREEQGLSMRELAERSGIGESTLHRIEHGPAVKTSAVRRPQPGKIARVFAVLGIDESALRALHVADDWVDEVVYWLTNSDGVAQYAEARRSPFARAADADLVLVHTDGTVIVLDVKFSPDGVSSRLDELAKAARSLGYMVAVPTPPPA